MKRYPFSLARPFSAPSSRRRFTDCSMIDVVSRSLVELVEIEPLPDYRLRVRFSDGTRGIADLSYLAGRGVFSLWLEAGAFERARVEEGRAVVWSESVDLGADSLYLQVTGKTPDQLFPNLGSTEARHA